MKNFIQTGDTIDALLAADATSGTPIVIGQLVGIPVASGVTGDTISVALKGVFELPKASGAITAGAKLYWHVANGNVTTTASGASFIGYAAAAYLSGDTEANVLLARLGS